MPQKKVVIPRLKLADTEIESVDKFNFLGITLDNLKQYQMLELAVALITAIHC